MLFICYGMVKSASTYTFQVVEDIIKTDCANKNLDYIKISELVDSLEYDFFDASTNIELVLDAINSSSYDFWGEHHLIVKTHLPYTFFENVIDARATKAILNYRHPAEIALSLVDVAKKEIASGKNRFSEYDSFDKAMAQLPYQVETFLSWFRTKNITSHIISYDDIAKQSVNVIRQVADFIGVDFDISDIVAKYEKDNTKIVEFNKGVFGRRFNEINEFELNMIENKFSEFFRLLEVSK